MALRKFSKVAEKFLDGPDQQNFIDHLLEFDPLNPETSLDTASLQPAFLVPHEIPVIEWKMINDAWKPVPKPPNNKPDAEKKLPKADFLVVTWTVAEALALSDALTPGFRSRTSDGKTDWFAYSRNWESKFKNMVTGMAPSKKVNRLGLWFKSEIKGRSVICFKSDLHMARDGKQLPVKELWKQLIEDVQPKMVITTGTAGGIGPEIQLGDVIVSQVVRFDCNRTFKDAPFKDKVFTCERKIQKGQFAKTNKTLMDFTTSRLPKAKRIAKIVDKGVPGIKPIDVVTTDFFAFDDDKDDYKLQGLGAAVEMGDATLALACQEMGEDAPMWVCVRNASDPQITGNLTLKEMADKAGRIYEKYGYWTTINSAIACWAIIVSAE